MQAAVAGALTNNTVVPTPTSYTVSSVAITGGTNESPTSTVTMVETFSGSSGSVTVQHRY